MLHAVSAPLLGSILLAGTLAGVGAMIDSPQGEAVTHRLRLHAVDEPNAVYLTVFRNGDISMKFDSGRLESFAYHTRARVSDGCRWLGTETFTPIDAKTFVYDYSETILSCAPGSTPARMTPRRGLVTVED